MPLEGFPDLKIEFDTAVPVLTNISAYVTEMNGYTIEQVLEELTSAGDATDRWAAVGFQQKSEITLAGPYDDTAGGLVALTIGQEGATRTLQITFDLGAAALKGALAGSRTGMGFPCTVVPASPVLAGLDLAITSPALAFSKRLVSR